MHLVVGLGNPGERYADTRHNVAWQVLDMLAARWRAAGGERSRSYETREARVADRTVVLMKPLTFMNLAGQAIEAWVGARSAPPDDLLMVSDDVYLPVGVLRLRLRGSSGGHRGLESVEQALGGQEFARLRIGVGAAATSAALKEHVLDAFTPEERVAVDEAIGRAADAVECWVTEGGIAAMNRFNRSAAQEESEP